MYPKQTGKQLIKVQNLIKRVGVTTKTRDLCWAVTNFKDFETTGEYEQNYH